MPLVEPIPDLVALDLLVTVGGTGSISAAAAVHGVTQPAASMRLRALEKALGLQLLERSPTGARLTPAGAATAQWAGVVLQAVRGLQAGVESLRDAGHGRLRIAASLTVTEYLLPSWLRRLAEAAPEVSVSLQMGNTARVADLVAGAEVDLGFVEGPVPPPRVPALHEREICDDELVVVVAPGHRWTRRRRPLTAADVAAGPLILREEGSGTREVLAAALAGQGLIAEASMELGSTTAIKAATVAGGGATALSRLAVAAEVAAGQLVVVPTTGLVLRRAIRALWPAGRPPGPVADRLLAIATSGS